MAGEQLIAVCRSWPDDTELQVRVGAEIVADDADLNCAAEACYDEISHRMGRTIDPGFLGKFQRSWAEFSVNALSNVMPIEPAGPLSLAGLAPIEAPTLCLVWHFPEYPLLARRFLRDGVFSIVGDDAAWLAPLVQQGLAGNFRTSSGLVRLKKALRARRSIAAAIDYCHANTRSLPIPFMGEICDTPAGIVEHCLGGGYRMQLITISNGEAIACRLDTDRCRDVVSILKTANRLVTDEILRSPGRWLMWPSLGSRMLRTAQRLRAQ